MTQPTAPLSAIGAIVDRRSPRRFDPDRPLDDALLDRILGLATHAPSEFDLQPWRFLVVRSAANRRRLRACAFNRPEVTDAQALVIALGYKHGLATDLGPMLERCDLTPDEAAEARGRATAGFARIEDRAAWATRSTMLAVSTLMLGAEALGVDSALIETFDPSRIRDEFGVPDDHAICALVALGYATESRPTPRPFGLDRVCYREHFGGPWNPDA